ncbi:MAG TPA: DUF1343 domain-containing protein [Chthonomonadaceae bacterium]|nr:DUF1343 domain-containing protein [Chthonomonadaceae bacterium]
MSSVPEGNNRLNPVACGIDVLQRDSFAPLRGRSVGLITNHTGLNRKGMATADLLRAAPEVRLRALFGPEHGIRGALDTKISDSKDKATGLPVYSLYGERTRPTAAQLAGLDTLVFDIQDIGTRFYTYISTLGLCLEAAAEHSLRFVVLDRPNPLGGLDVEGPLADPDQLSFTAYHPIPIRHGLTVGEMARLFQAEKRIGADLHVVPVEGWRRADFWDATNLTWVNPSPNMRSLTGALLYPGIGLLETTNVSVGRGTDTPFEIIGAPWLDGRLLAAELNARDLPGVRFVPVRFTPKSSVHAGSVCGGINVIITARHRFVPVYTGMVVAETLLRLYPQAWEADRFHRLLVNAEAFAAFRAGATAETLTRSWQKQVEAFRRRRRPHLLYS